MSVYGSPATDSARKGNQFRRSPAPSSLTNSHENGDTPHALHFWPSRGILSRLTGQKQTPQPSPAASQQQPQNRSLLTRSNIEQSSTPSASSATPASDSFQVRKGYKVAHLNLVSGMVSESSNMSSPSTLLTPLMTDKLTTPRVTPSLTSSVPATIAGGKRSVIPRQSIVLERDCTYEQGILINGRLCITATTVLFFAKREQSPFVHSTPTKAQQTKEDLADDEESGPPLLVVLLEQVEDVRLDDGESSVPGIEIVMLPYAVVHSVLPSYFFGFSTIEQAKIVHKTLKKLLRRINRHTSTKGRRSNAMSRKSQQELEQPQQQAGQQQLDDDDDTAARHCLSNDESLSKDAKPLEESISDDGKNWSTLRSTLELEHKMLFDEAPHITRFSPEALKRRSTLSETSGNVSESSTGSQDSTEKAYPFAEYGPSDEPLSQTESESLSLSRMPMRDAVDIEDNDSYYVCTCPHCSQLISLNKQLLSQLSAKSKQFEKTETSVGIIHGNSITQLSMLDPFAVLPIPVLYLSIFVIFLFVTALIIFL